MYERKLGRKHYLFWFLKLRLIDKEDLQFERKKEKRKYFSGYCVQDLS